MFRMRERLKLARARRVSDQAIQQISHQLEQAAATWSFESLRMAAVDALVYGLYVLTADEIKLVATTAN